MSSPVHKRTREEGHTTAQSPSPNKAAIKRAERVSHAVDPVIGSPAPSPKKSCPPAPKKPQPLWGHSLSAPFVRASRQIRDFISAKCLETHMEPFQLEIGPGVEVTIDSVAFLSAKGNFKEVFKCTVRDRGEWVIKLIKTDILERTPERAVTCAADQLMHYAQNRQDPVLKEYIVEHSNLEYHVQATVDLLKLDAAERASAFRAYVQKSFTQGFVFTPFVPHEFPLQFDPNDTRWIQLKTILARGVATGICNDLSRDNVRTVPLPDGRERVLLIDPLDMDGDEDVNPTIYANSFTKDPVAQEWLLEDNG